MSEPGGRRGAETSAQAPIAVVVDGPPTPAWQARVVEALDASKIVSVDELRIVGGATRQGLARRLRTALERRVFAIGSNPELPVTLGSRASSQAVGLVLWLAESEPPVGQTADLATLRHGNRSEPAEDAFRRALLSGASCVESEIVLSCDGETRVIARTVSEVRPFSEALSRTLALWKLAAMVPRSLDRLLQGNDGSCAPVVARTSETPAADGGTHTAETTISRATTPRPDPLGRSLATDVALLVRASISALRALLTRACFRRPWSILVVEDDAPQPSVERGFGEDLVRWGHARMYADPFLFSHEGRHHLFCEEVPNGEKLGVISHTELPLDGGMAAPPMPVLRAAHHLSYPFVFAKEDDVFMIPETSAARRIELYRARAFPGGWELEAILLEDINAADATLLAHDGLLWLFASVAAPGASTLDELHLFWAEKLRGPWRAHPHNPIVSDVRCARPAGAVQRWGSRLVRPAQDCSQRYGWAISYRQIDVLSTTDYSEHELNRIEPSSLVGARATHTYASDGRFQALDVRHREWRLRPRRSRTAGLGRRHTPPRPTTE